MKDLRENSPNLSYCLNHGLTLVVTKRFFINWYFGEKSTKAEPEVKNIKKFLSLLLASLSSQELLVNSFLCYWHHFLHRNCRSWSLVWKEFVARNRLENLKCWKWLVKVIDRPTQTTLCGFAVAAREPLKFCSDEHIFERFSFFVWYNRRRCINCFQQWLILDETPFLHQCLF